MIFSRLQKGRKRKWRTVDVGEKIRDEGETARKREKEREEGGGGILCAKMNTGPQG